MNLTYKIFFALSLSSSLIACGADSSGSSDDDSAPTTGDDQNVTAARASARIELFEGLDGQHYFHLVAKNGEIMLQSEGYASADKAKQGVSSVLENATRSSSFEMRDARDGESYFVVKADNNKIIATSETYVSRSNADRAATAAKALVRELAGKQPENAAAGAKFETFLGNDELMYFQMRAKNGETILASQGYQSLQGAKKGVNSVKENGIDESRFEIIEARDGQFYFRLKAANGEVIGRSEMYITKSNASRARDTVIALLRSGEAR
jgi:uncharacterized protein